MSKVRRRRKKFRIGPTQGAALQVAAYVKTSTGHAWTLIDGADVDLRIWASGDDIASNHAGGLGDVALMFVVVPDPEADAGLPGITDVRSAVERLVNGEVPA